MHSLGGEIRHVGSEIHLLDAAGKVLHVAQYDSAKKISPDPLTTKRAVTPHTAGRVAYAYWSSNSLSPISTFSSSWIVPPYPTVSSGQTIFLYSSLEATSGSAILLPALQYGPSSAGGGPSWTVATWYITGSAVYYTTTYGVFPGQGVIGLIDFIPPSNGTYNYIAEFDGLGIPASGSLHVTGSVQLVQATESLAAYGIASINNYPVGSTIFSSISLTVTTGVPGIYWNAVSDAADGITTTVNTQGATNAKITIKY